MKRRMSTVIPAVAVLAIAALTMMAAVDGAVARATHEKFEFTGVTFADGTVGTIRASVKITRKGSAAVASYFTAADGYLGQYQELDGFASSDPGQVRQWALDHYQDRQ